MKQSTFVQMKFEVLPTINKMLGLYEKPRTMERFNEYIRTLQGDTKGDLIMPIGGFNPMAKEHVVEKLLELKYPDAEKIIHDALSELNVELKNEKDSSTFKVALNLSDDLQGGWTNRFTNDYDSKFKINALVNRKFCTPVFWTSENFSEDLIRERTLEYAYRTIYWLTNPKPKTLEEHVAQEKFAMKKSNGNINSDISIAETFYKTHLHSDDYHIIFNFFYGDAASKSLEFPTFGMPGNMLGFEYAKHRR
jgi:hypothetical protein